MHKIFYKLAWVTILSAMSLMSLIGYWLFFPYKTINFKDKTLKIENSVVKAGGELTYFVEACGFTNIVPEITKTFVDGIVYVVPPSTSIPKKGCNSTKVRVVVPKSLPEGIYHLEMTYRYKINPIRTIDISIQTEKFIVKK